VNIEERIDANGCVKFAYMVNDGQCEKLLIIPAQASKNNKKPGKWRILSARFLILCAGTLLLPIIILSHYFTASQLKLQETALFE
jgi:hypothetical protein